MVYLFIGQDSLSKNIKLKRLREEFLARELEEFNIDIAYGKELTLMELQERLLCLPFKAPRRMMVIKDAQRLKEEIKDFLLEYVEKPRAAILLVLDMDRQDPKDGFVRGLARHAQVYRFREQQDVNAFTLCRQIDLQRTANALDVLNQLLENGEKPERILGGLRYAWENGAMGPLETRKRLKLLLDCDIDIKTGRLKPAYALERFVVNLCGIGKSLTRY